MNNKPLIVATSVGSVLQLGMVIAGHEITSIQSMFLWGGLLFSAIAGALYAKFSKGSVASDLKGGLIAGGVCAFLGILVSHLLGDVPAPVLAFGSVSSAVTGLIGAAVGRYFK